MKAVAVFPAHPMHEATDLLSAHASGIKHVISLENR